MEKRKSVVRNLTFLYYTVYLLMIVLIAVYYYFLRQGEPEAVDLQSQFAMIVQYIAIGLTLVCVPGGLYLHKYYCDKLKSQSDEDAQLDKYFQVSIVRLCLMSLPLIASICAFFMLNGYRPMIYCAGISAIALIFCKPTMAKLEMDLDLDS